MQKRFAMLKRVFEFVGFAFILVSPISTFASENADFDILNIGKTSWYFESPEIASVVEFHANHPPVLMFKAPSEVEICRLNGIPCDPTQGIQLIGEIQRPALREVGLTYKLKSEQQRILKFRFFPKISPDFKIQGASSLKKSILLAPGAYLLALSPNGKVLYYKEPGPEVQNFRQHLVEGKFIYTYFRVTKSTLGISADGLIEFLDEDFQPIGYLNREMDGHEFIVLGPRHFLFTEYAAIDDGPNCQLEERLIELRDGVEVRRFSSLGVEKLQTKEMQIFEFHGRMCKTATHINAVQVVDSSHWLISLGWETFLMWNHSNNTIEWVYGGANPTVPLIANLDLSLFHSPFWDRTTKTIRFFNNGSIRTQLIALTFRSGHKKPKIRRIDFENSFSDYGGNLVLDFERGHEFLSTAIGHRVRGNWDVREYKNEKLTMAIRLGPVGTYNYRVNRGVIR
jgi:hypothetical protein